MWTAKASSAASTSPLYQMVPRERQQARAPAHRHAGADGRTIIDGTDRTPGKGIGHLIAFDAQGNLLADEHIAEADTTI
jgi:hypothetical protein